MLPLLLAVMAALTVGLLFGVPVGGALVLLDVAAIGALAGAILQAAVHLVGRRPVRRWTLGLVTVAAGTAGAHLSLAPAAPAVILIVVDCLRADRLTPALMPKTDALAQSSMRFTQARSQSSWTRSSMPSLLSGRFPTEHGLYRTHPRPDRIRDQVPMLAELFSDGGWLTGGFVEQAQLDAAFGYDRGFGRYGFHDGNAAQLDSKFIAWNTLFRTVPRFALLHYIDTQEEHHKTRTFQDEYRAFLTKYGIEYDERYVWD